MRGSLPDLQLLLPEGMRIDMAYDSSEFIQSSVDEVGKTIASASTKDKSAKTASGANAAVAAEIAKHMAAPQGAARK